jgi:tetratricopeptide (TPR) repeat protein
MVASVSTQSAHPVGTARPRDLAAEAQRLLQAGDTEAAADCYGRLVSLAPENPTLRHNLASLLADAGRFDEAEGEARRAMAGGIDAPETWLVLAHALQGQARYPEAVRAYREALRRRPAFPPAHKDLAELIWMRTGDATAALAPLEAALRDRPGDPQLLARKAQVLEYTGDPAGGYRLLADAAERTGDPWLHVAAAQAALAGAPGAALAHAERAAAAGLSHRTALVTLCEARLAAGQATAAAALASALVAADPLDQRALCLQGTAWRLADDPRWRGLFDFPALVLGFRLTPPDGWEDLDGFLADLASELIALHRLCAHPIGQSVRGGAQTQQNLLRATTPAVRGFFRAIDPAVRAYLEAVGAAGRLPGWAAPYDYRITGAWSVLLAPGGRHVSHMHPSGRVSSAFHVNVPCAVDQGRAGWLAFGEPDVPTSPPLAPDHHVRPEPGRLVLFPSYLPHGTVPFGGDERRLTIAFDLGPAPGRGSA